MMKTETCGSPCPLDSVSQCPLHSKQLKVIEFFSGIGGVSFALESLKVPTDVSVTGMDINTVANDVYTFNFPHNELLPRNLNGIKAQQLDSIGADVWTMSPPCQPFTRYARNEYRLDLNVRFD